MTTLINRTLYPGVLTYLFVVLFCAHCLCQDVAKPSEDEQAALAAGEKKISEQILKVLEHFQQAEPVGLPGAEIPDPYPIPDMQQSFSIAKMHFKQVFARGLGKFKIKYVQAEISAMEVNAAMSIDRLQVVGNYILSTWLSRTQGPFTVNITDINVQAKANLAIEREGKLSTQDISMDITFKTISMNFENLGLLGNTFQGFLNSAGTFLFDSIKPHILKQAYTKIRTEVNANLNKVAGDVQFPNSISPLDMVIADARKMVRDKGLDPYQVENYNSSVNMFEITLSHTWLTGLSSFHRVGNITLTMVNNVVYADFEIGTQKLQGTTHWDISSIGGIVSRAGTASFSVEYISARIIIGQPLDTRQHPQFKSWDLDLGNIQVRCDGAGTLDYIIEVVVNVLPNLLRYQIVDGLEGPIRDWCQQKFFDDLEVDKLIKSKLPEIEKLAQKGFKLSSIKMHQPRQEVLSDDDFFNF